MSELKKSDESEFPYFNRELSWLAFNQRVLEQAKSIDYPLLERMKFLAFFSSNLDEFFEIRVSGLMQQIKSGVNEISADGLNPKEQLSKIRKTVNRLITEQAECWKTQIMPLLAENNILFCDQDLTANVRVRQQEYIAKSKPVTLEMVESWSLATRLWNNSLALLGPVL